ncbi:unnamed protein product [Kluyveromyces dobzhanskii CBS 2104]|uniref:Crossover junction endonuclease MUS81 n=1 Tax=Kluyveromyces dobzhanskii CBS 2104 TaxID=1427455 RepID=A0A0A8L7P3_9SACH|nr:unnamed protein product [Kluyveromyces dobzhanskii CBS 2104]
MSLPADAKQLYVEFLQQEVNQSTSAHQEKLVMVLNRALFALKNYADPIYHPKDLLKVKGIGQTTMSKLAKRLKAYCEESGYPFPVESSTTDDSQSTQTDSNPNNTQKTRVRTVDQEQEESQNTRKRRKKKYIPRNRSGGYGILLGLLELGCDKEGMSCTRRQLIAVASKYCDQSYEKNPSTKEFYSAWSAVKSLKTNDLVTEQGRPSQFSLTEEGKLLAESLKNANDIEFDPSSVYERRQNRIATNNSSFLNDDEQDRTVNFSGLMNHANISIDKSVDSSRLFLDATINSSRIEQTEENDVPVVSTPISKQAVSKGRWKGVKYELWKPGSYDIVLHIDHREVRSKEDRGFFARKLSQRGIQTQSSSLIVGDMIWLAKHKQSGKQCALNFIVERKRLDDLIISIRDNRFAEQKNRLKKTGCKHTFYLVEETTGYNVAESADAMKTSIWSTVIYNDFHIKRTKNADTTVQWLTDMSLIIKDLYLKKSLVVINHDHISNQDIYLTSLKMFRTEFERNKEIECCHNYESMQSAMVKTNLMTVKELYLRALMTVKGISLEKALMIQSKFPTFKSLLNAYRRCASEPNAKALIQNELKDAPGNRKIGPTLSQTLWETFGKL